MAICLGIAIPAHSKEAARSWLYHSWQTDDGLPNNDVTWIGQAAKGASNGLRNMQARAEALGGKCHIDNQPGVGTIISMHLPWPATPATNETATGKT